MRFTLSYFVFYSAQYLQTNSWKVTLFGVTGSTSVVCTTYSKLPPSQGEEEDGTSR